MIGRSFRSELRPHVWGSGLSAAERRHFLPEGGIASKDRNRRGSTPTSNFFCISFPAHRPPPIFILSEIVSNWVYFHSCLETASFIRPSPLSRFPMPPITYPYRSNAGVRYPRSTPSILNPSQPKARNRLNRVLKTFSLSMPL